MRSPSFKRPFATAESRCVKRQPLTRCGWKRAGRCSGCDECARVCPADIRLDLINRKLALEVEKQYGNVGLDPEQKAALVDFRMEDSEEFIL